MPTLKVNEIVSYSGNTLTIGASTDTLSYVGAVVKADTIQNASASNLVVQTNTTTITIGRTGQTVSLASGASSSGFGATYNGAVNWTSTLVTSALTVSSGVGYFVNTSSAAITATLPASPTVGSTIAFSDYNRTWATNNFTINPNSNKYQGGTANAVYSTNGQNLTITYADSTKGWIPTVDDDVANTQSYSIDFLVVAGGGGGGSNEAASGGGAGGYRTTTLTIDSGTVITATVGSGGAAASQGGNSSISGSGITTFTSAGGGAGSNTYGADGGSGGGAGRGAPNGTAGGLGNVPSVSPSQGNNGGVNYRSGGAQNGSGGGGGASAVGANASSGGGGNGGSGTSSSITGSSVTYAGGGGGGAEASTAGSGGSGGGGAGSNTSGVATSATVNTGGGGGGAGYSSGGGTGGAGGSGIIILRMLTTKYTGTTTGSPTVTTDGSYKVVKFTGTGTYTA